MSDVLWYNYIYAAKVFFLYPFNLLLKSTILSSSAIATVTTYFKICSNTEFVMQLVVKKYRSCDLQKQSINV